MKDSECNSKCMFIKQPFSLPMLFSLKWKELRELCIVTNETLWSLSAVYTVH